MIDKWNWANVYIVLNNYDSGLKYLVNINLEKKIKLFKFWKKKMSKNLPILSHDLTKGKWYKKVIIKSHIINSFIFLAKDIQAQKEKERRQSLDNLLKRSKF